MPVGFKLEDTFGLALCQHRVGVGIVIVEVRNAEIRVLAAHGQLGIMDDRQRAQTQKIHFQKTQTLDLHHVELGHGRPSLVDSGTYSVAGSRVMTTPAAWVEAWRGMPSTFSEVSISSCT